VWRAHVGIASNLQHTIKSSFLEAIYLDAAENTFADASLEDEIGHDTKGASRICNKF
jgi:hypothetical protein